MASLVIRDFHRWVVLLVLFLVRAAVVLVQLPLVPAQFHYERANVPDRRLRLLLQLSYIVVVPAASFLALRAAGIFAIFWWRSVRPFLMLVRWPAVISSF